MADDPAHDFTAIVVSNFFLLSSHSSLFHSFYADYFLSKFLSKSYEMLNPDVLLLLGDISAEGYQLTKNKWSSVLHQFKRILGSYLHIPFHFTLRDRDIDLCDKMEASTLHRVAPAFPDLDSAGCGSFEFKSVSFVAAMNLSLISREWLKGRKHEPFIELKVPETSYEYQTERRSCSVTVWACSLASLSHASIIRVLLQAREWQDNHV